MPPLPLRTWPAWACFRHLQGFADQLRSRAAAASIRAEDGICAEPSGPLRCRSGGVATGAARRRPRRQLVLGPLGAQLDRRRVAAQLGPALPRFGPEAVEELVGVQRVVVEEDGALGAGAAGEGERVAQRRVAPADVVGVLGVGVLAVVDQQRGVAGEREAGDPLLLEPVEVGAEAGLVVGDVGERGVAVVDPVAERRAAVGDRGGADPGRADLPLAVGGGGGRRRRRAARAPRPARAGRRCSGRCGRAARPRARPAPRSRSRSAAGRRGRRRRGRGCGRGGGG